MASQVALLIWRSGQRKSSRYYMTPKGGWPLSSWIANMSIEQLTCRNGQAHQLQMVSCIEWPRSTLAGGPVCLSTLNLKLLVLWHAALRLRLPKLNRLKIALACFVCLTQHTVKVMVLVSTDVTQTLICWLVDSWECKARHWQTALGLAGDNASDASALPTRRNC